MKPEATGDCALCLAKDVPIRDSHIIPKWAFKKARASAGPGNPNPVFVDDARVLQTSVQWRQRLLCSSCEGRFGVVENRIARIVFPEIGLAPILLELRPRVGWIRTDQTHRIGLAPLSMALTDDLLYFATSVIWRSHVAERRNAGAVHLGPVAAEALRKYLLGETQFPNGVGCQVIVMEPGDSEWERALCSIGSEPISVRSGQGFVHEFAIHGIYFRLSVGIGMSLPRDLGLFSLSDPTGGLAIVLQPSHIGNLRGAVERLVSLPML